MKALHPERLTDAEPILARIESITHEGLGVTHIDGKAVFIDGALPGESVRYRTRKRGKHYDIGRLIELVEASPERVTPRCRYFGVCGGCSLQHLRAESQLSAKQKILGETLSRIGKVTPGGWLPALSGPHWGYRRKARLGVRVVPKKGGVIVGFREKRSALLTPLDSCDVLHPRVSELLPVLRARIASLSIADRIPQVEIAVGDNAIAFVFRHLLPLTPDDTQMLASFGRAHDIHVYLQPGRPDQLTPVWPESPAPLFYRMTAENLEFAFAPTDFIQVNAGLNEHMVARACKLLDVKRGDRVLDLFCGLGNFTLVLARHGAVVLGIEADSALIEKARINARRNEIHNVEFAQADLYSAIPPDPWANRQFDKWLLDPPRSGAMEVLKRLPDRGGPERIVYVSCNPGTLARDSELLVHSKGYRLAAAGVMDMFPQTSHVEAMALFERAS